MYCDLSPGDRQVLEHCRDTGPSGVGRGNANAHLLGHFSKAMLKRDLASAALGDDLRHSTSRQLEPSKVRAVWTREIRSWIEVSWI